jgi:hypothetical protein
MVPLLKSGSGNSILDRRPFARVASNTVSRRARILSFGTAAVVTLAGVAAAVAGGLVGQALAIALISLGLGGALLLIFF